MATEKKGSFLLKVLYHFFIAISAIIGAVLGIINFMNSNSEIERAYIQNQLDIAKRYYDEKNYDNLMQVYSDKKLQNNPQVLLNTGVMYAQGIGFYKDTEKAKYYFRRAMDAGESRYSFLYLTQLSDYDDADEVISLIALGCLNNSLYCEKILQEIYISAGIDCDGPYLLDFNQRSEEERRKILESVFLYAGDAKYNAATKWKYTADEQQIGDQTVYTNVQAEAVETEERSVPIYIKPYFGEVEIEMVFE